MTVRTKPGDQFHEVPLFHRGTARRWSINPTPDMEKNRAARPGNWRIGIVPYLYQPTVSKIVVPHFLFSKPSRRIRWIVDRNEAIVLGIAYIIDPRVCSGHLMEGEISAGRQCGVVSVDLADPKNAGWGASVALFLVQSNFVLTRQATAPGKTVFPKENRKPHARRLPSAASCAFKKLCLTVHRIPIRSGSDDHLRAIIGKTRGMSAACQKEKRR
jgi:hypothetical protein